MFEKPALAIEHPQEFTAVATALDAAFAPRTVEDFLYRIGRAGLRARNFEAVLAKGLLGKDAAPQYARLGPSDQGQIRERYLRLVESVAPELRARFLKVYAYY